MFTFEDARNSLKGHGSVLPKMTHKVRAALLNGRPSRRMYAVATEDYSRAWLKITVPKGTIIPVVLYSDSPDMFRIDGEDWLDFALGTAFELII